MSSVSAPSRVRDHLAKAVYDDDSAPVRNLLARILV
jgi:hypothetical protein